ncbi:DNA methyltransferase [Methanoculleus sp.]|uniref:DNA-methyltransferase n=1 Tax=Methanoculleus sp. TaxID=90427 RepID=UPI0025EF405D|nr:DNA methyltransferase [Methanoculleus sp.]MCK9319545.1 site-specific DNA-methyltransferase [Methanoculleus sp.]
MEKRIKMNQEYRNKVIQGNNLEVLKQIPDNTFDSVVTDPPYGISFMGKKWDYDVPSVETWQEVFRVLKPGGHMLVACGTKTQHRMAVNIEDAGFEIRDIVAWVYGSGFPKSMDVSKAIDKRLGAEREVIGKSNNARPNSKKENNLYQAGTVGKDFNLTAPSTEEAKQWQGWGTALKPAMELWTLARKPLKGTVAQNVLEYGVGGLNIDGCRVGVEEITTNGSGKQKNSWLPKSDKPLNTTHTGRFPANLIHDGSEEVVSLFPHTESGKMTSQHQRHTDGSPNGIYGKFDVNHPLSETYGDEGSASRFFYVPKASQKERNFGLEGFVKKQKVFNGQSDKSSKEMKGVEAKFTTKPKANIHPTVKPIDLMRYLVRMITPKGGIVLEPYAGSGTTLIACKLESMQYVGIEIEKDYIDIIEARLEAYQNYDDSMDTKTVIKESNKDLKEKDFGILNIFDFL